MLDAERENLLPLLRETPVAAFERPTLCPTWSVRDVLAHSAAALCKVADVGWYDNSAEGNQADVDARRDWPIDRILAELDRGYREAGPVIDASDGKLVNSAFGAWIHGGDVRDGLGAPGAFSSAGVEDALHVLRTAERTTAKTPLVEVRLPDRTFTMGGAIEGRETAVLTTDLPNLIRLYTNRSPDVARFTLIGATPEELNVYR